MSNSSLLQGSHLKILLRRLSKQGVEALVKSIEYATLQLRSILARFSKFEFLNRVMQRSTYWLIYNYGKWQSKLITTVDSAINSDHSTYFPQYVLFMKVLLWKCCNEIDIYRVEFLAHLVFYQRSLCNHDLSVVHSCHLMPASALASVHSPPSHMIQDRNFIFSMNMHMCPQYMHIKYLVILTCSF